MSVSTPLWRSQLGAHQAAGAVADHEAEQDPHPQYEQAVQHNLSASTAPTVNDDSSAGYAPRSLWFDQVADEVYRCLDASDGAAVWVKTSLTLDELGSAASAEVADFDPAGSAVAVTPMAFVKADGSQPAWTAPTGATLEAASDLAAVVGSTIVEIAAGTAVTLPALAAGTDYTIYAATDGSLQAVDADSAAPVGERPVGGFHASAGASEIVAASLWDLNWRPKCPNPRGMVYDDKRGTWADIYLMHVDYGIDGYSRNGQQIADSSSPPKIPSVYGGDGTATHGLLTWYEAVDLAAAAGKRLPSYAEFTSLAFGVVEQQSVGSDPGTTQHQAGHRSAIGCEQITGVMWQWGADINGTSATGSVSWQAITDGRGSVYTHSIRAVLLGANWSGGSYSGSRASYWSRAPDVSRSYIGARAASDHLNLQPAA